MNKFQEILFSILLFAGKPLLLNLGRDYHAKDPVGAKLAIAEAYPLIDTKLEEWVKKSETQTDDNVVQKAKEVCEELAAEWGLTLSNVDAGTPND